MELLKRAADQATLIGDHALVSGLMTAALQLVETADEDSLVEVHTARHAALVSLGQFEEADVDYRAIEHFATPRTSGRSRRRGRSAASRTAAVWPRRRAGLRALRECGIDVPAPAELQARLDRRLETLFHWLNETDEADDLAKPDVTDPKLLTAGRLLDALLAPTFFLGDLRMYSWVSLEALHIWAEHGPAATLTGPPRTRPPSS